MAISTRRSPDGTFVYLLIDGHEIGIRPSQLREVIAVLEAEAE